MPEHKWIDSQDMHYLKIVAAGRMGPARSDVEMLLADLDEAKRLLRECANMLAWISGDTNFRECGYPSTIEREDDLLCRIRAVPGVVEAGGN